jgi:hypothetical protein
LSGAARLSVRDGGTRCSTHGEAEETLSSGEFEGRFHESQSTHEMTKEADRVAGKEARLARVTRQHESFGKAHARGRDVGGLDGLPGWSASHGSSALP